MGRILLISSQVAASRVGASAGAFVLQRMGHEVVVLPTVLLGRHPGWGAPGGGAVETERLESLWEGVAAQGLAFDAVLTGYFASAAQVELAERIVAEVDPERCLVDPVIGDSDSGMYVREAVAEAIRDRLVPRADIITPNQWEHDWLTEAAHLPRGVAELITSYSEGGSIGALYRDGEVEMTVSHERFADVPHGGGDTLAALWLANALRGVGREANLARSVGSVLGILRAAVDADAGELPLVREQARLLAPEELEVKHVG